MSLRKKPKADLKKYYTVFLEFGLVVSLGLFIIAAKVTIRPHENNNNNVSKQQEVVKMKKIKQTKQEKTPPPPPRPQTPVAVPNDQVVEDNNLNFSADMNLDQPLPEPPAPKQGGGNNNNSNHVFVAVQQMPKLIGGIAQLQKKVKYPERCREANIQGRVVIQFVVNKQGNVENPKVIRGIGGGCDQAALKAVKQYAHFKPGRQRGKPVPVRYSLPITFRLQQ